MRIYNPQVQELFFHSTKAEKLYFEANYNANSYLIFGSETKGLSEVVRQSFAPAQGLKLPMLTGQRSLNLSNAVAVTVFEAWRQNEFAAATLAAS